MTKEQAGWSYNPASLILVGEITETLRAQGNITATGVRIDDSIDSPVIDGVYHEIPQAQIGFMQYSEFANSAKKFNEMPSTETAYSGKHPWNIVGATSLDAVFYPYTTITDEYRAGKWLPYWTKPTASDQPTSNELNPFNPFNVLDGINPKGQYTVDNDPWMASGHNIAMALNYNPKDSGITGSGGFVGATGVYPSGSGSPVDFYFEKDHWARRTVETSGIRGVGFKAPMVLTGWGYDIDGNPVPSSGNTFHPESMYNPHLWKSGPVDLRWDNTRGVWTGGNTTIISLVKVTNTYNPPNFSYEVDRSYNRSQFSRNSPSVQRTFAADDPIYDAEYVAYTGNPDNTGVYEQLDFAGLEFPYYEAFVIRDTRDAVGAGNYYNSWTEDCEDCGHVSNPCPSGSFPRHESSGTIIENKKILIENPLRQNLDVGDLAFTVNTGRKKNINTGSFTGGTGESGIVTLTTDASGNASINVVNSGTGYTFGAFAVPVGGCNICTDIALTVAGGKITGGTLTPSGGFPNNASCSVDVYPNDATVQTESLPIHWILQAEFKSQQFVTHVECDAGLLQTCSMKIQTQGFKTCEWCGEDTTLINSF